MRKSLSLVLITKDLITYVALSLLIAYHQLFCIGQRNPILPHTRASMKKRDNIFEGHLADMKLNDEEMNIITAEQMQIDDEKEAPTRLFRNLVLQFSQRRRQSHDGSRPDSTVPGEMQNLTGEYVKDPRPDHV